MDYLHPTGQLASQNTGRSGTIPRPCLSTGCEMLSAPNPIRYTSQRTDFGTIFAIIPRPGHHISSGFSPVLSLPTVINARRNHFPGIGSSRKISIDPCRTGIWCGKCLLDAFRSRFSESLCRSPGSGTRIARRHMASFSCPTGQKLFCFGTSARRSRETYRFPLLYV